MIRQVRHGRRILHDHGRRHDPGAAEHADVAVTSTAKALRPGRRYGAMSYSSYRSRRGCERIGPRPTSTPLTQNTYRESADRRSGARGGRSSTSNTRRNWARENSAGGRSEPTLVGSITNSGTSGRPSDRATAHQGNRQSTYQNLTWSARYIWTVTRLPASAIRSVVVSTVPSRIKPGSGID
jgi:hypothetical protein